MGDWDRRRSYYGEFERGRDREREDYTHSLGTDFISGADSALRSTNNARIQLIESLDREEQKKHERIRYLKEKEREYEDRLAERRRMIDLTNEEMLKQQAIIDDNKRVITEMVLEKDARKARLDDLQGMKEDMNNDIRKRRDELQRLEHERHRAAAELTSTRNQVRALREDMAKLAEMERTYRDELDHQRAELHKLKVEQTRQVDSLRLLSRDLDLARHEYGDLDHEVRRLDDIDKRARKELEMRRMRIDELAELENRFSKEVERLASARAEYGYTVDRLAATEERQRYELSTLERRASLSHPAAYPPMTGPLPFSAYAPPYSTGAPVASYYGPPQAGPVGTRPVLTAAAVAPTPYRSGAVANVVQH